jgi:hypothetical protein
MDLEILSGGLLVFSAAVALVCLLTFALMKITRPVGFFLNQDRRWLRDFLLNHAAVFFGFRPGAVGAWGDTALGKWVSSWDKALITSRALRAAWVVLILCLVVPFRSADPVWIRSFALMVLTLFGFARLLLFSKASDVLISVSALVGIVGLVTTSPWLVLKAAAFGMPFYEVLFVLNALLGAGLFWAASKKWEQLLQGVGFAVVCALAYRLWPGFFDGGDAFRASAPYIGVALGFLMALTSWACLAELMRRDLRVGGPMPEFDPECPRDYYYFPPRLELYGFVCLSAFLLYYGISWLDTDLHLFDAAAGSLAWQYLFYLLDITLQQIPVIGDLIDQLLHRQTLQDMSVDIRQFIVDLTVKKIIKLLMLAALLVAGVRSLAAISRLAKRRLAGNLGKKAACKAEEGSFPDIGKVVEDAREGGPEFVHQALLAADKVLSRSRLRAEFSPFNAVGSFGMGAPFLGYLLNNKAQHAAIRRSFLDAGSVAIKDYLDWLTRPIWPVLLNSQAVSASRPLKDIVQGLRQAKSEWSADRAPLNFAALLNELGVELSRLVEEKWLEDGADLAEFAELLEEAAALMADAALTFGGHLGIIDFSAVLHNRGIALWMLARLRGDKTKAQEAIECFEAAINDTSASGFSGQILVHGSRPETDVAASHLFCATAIALMYDLTRDDRHCFQAMEHYRAAIEVFDASASRILFARENLIQSLMHAANAAMLFGQWNLAVSYLYQAKREWSDTGMRFPNGADLKRKIIKRYAFAAVTLAKVVNSHGLPHEPNDRNVTSSLRRAKAAILMLLKESDLKDLVTKAARSKDAKIAARNDLRSVMLLAGYAAWMHLEMRLSASDKSCTVAEELSGFVGSIAKMLQGSVAWSPGKDLVQEPDKDKDKAEKDKQEFDKKIKELTAKEAEKIRKSVEDVLKGI